MTIREAEVYLFELPRFADQGAAALKPGLDRIRRLLAAMGDPQDTFRSVHVAGTNGKGSTASMVAAIATAAGLRTGLHTSPHLLRVHERMRLDGVPAPEAWLAEAVARFRPVLDDVQPSFFEATVALSFRYFADAAVDLAVVEVGLGGRFDATNVLRPEAALVTSIGLDHTDLLGTTREAIAAEKAGIFKPGVPALTSAEGAGVLAVLCDVAAAQGVPLHIVHEEVAVKPVGAEADVQRIALQTPLRRYDDLALDLPGAHQVLNATLAVRAAELVLAPVQASAVPVYEGLQRVRTLAGLQGRLQAVRQDPLLIADVAHNPDGIGRALGYAQAQAVARGGRLRVLLGLMQDKAVSEVVVQLAAAGAATFALALPGERALQPEALAAALRRAGAEVGGTGTARQGLDWSARTGTPADVVLATGSHQVVADVLRVLEKG